MGVIFSLGIEQACRSSQDFCINAQKVQICCRVTFFPFELWPRASKNTSFHLSCLKSLMDNRGFNVPKS